jgi:hypothetical protein
LSAPQKDQQDKDMQRLSELISKPKFDPYVKLVSDALHLAAGADSLQQVKIMTLQAYAYNSLKEEKDRISSEDLEVIDSVSRALLSPVRTFYHTTQFITVPWGFRDTRENYERYVRPWDCAYLEHFPELLRDGPVDSGEDLRYRAFFATSACLTEAGYQSLVSAFTHWSAPKVAGIWAKIAKGVVSKSGLVDPDKVNVSKI